MSAEPPSPWTDILSRTTLRLALIGILQYVVLSLIGDASIAIKITTILIATSAFLTLQFEMTLRHWWQHSFGIVLTTLAVVYALAVGYAIESRQPPFAITEDFAFINLTQRLETNNSGYFWIVYRSAQAGGGIVASPVALLVWLTITNLTDAPLRVETYSLAVKTDNCGWIQLLHIPLSGMSVYWTFEGLNKSILEDFSTNGLDYALEKPINAHDTAQGFSFWDTPVACKVGSGDVAYDVRLNTYSGISFHHRSRMAQLPDKERFTRGIPFVLPHGSQRVDISGFPRKLWISEAK